MLEAAYNDAAGVTAEFNRNILRVVNRLAGGDFRPERFAHRAFWDARNRWIEMRLVALGRQEVHLAKPRLGFVLEDGEELLTEISSKYDRHQVTRLLGAGGFDLDRWLEHPRKLFALALARRRDTVPSA